MNQKTRRRLLIVLIIGFLLTASGFLFCALGWSLNQTPFGELTFKKTGAILLKTQPSDAFIKINNQPYARKHNLLINNGRELISGVLPGDYQIEVFKDGFGRWQKNLSVAAGLISSATKIVLFSEKIPTELTAKTEVEKFWFTAEKQKEAENLFYSLKQKQLKMPGRVPIIQITTVPFDINKILIASQRALYFLDRQNFTLELLALTSVNALTTNGSEIIFVDQENNLQIYEVQLRKITEKIALELSGQAVKIAVSKSHNKIALLNEEGKLFIYERKNGELKSISEKIKDFRFSPDSKKIAVLTQAGSLEIIFLEDYHRDFTMTAGEKLEIKIQKEGEILDFDWLLQFPDYLVLRYLDEMIIAEVDQRLPINWWLLAENIQDFAFDQENNLYLLQNNQFLKVVW
jgi:hypothetical protein